jgi:hypothetical protein
MVVKYSCSSLNRCAKDTRQHSLYKITCVAQFILLKVRYVDHDPSSFISFLIPSHNPSHMRTFPTLHTGSYTLCFPLCLFLFFISVFLPSFQLVVQSRSRDSSVGIALGYGLDDRGFESRQGPGIFLFTIVSIPALGLFPWGKAAGS